MKHRHRLLCLLLAAVASTAATAAPRAASGRRVLTLSFVGDLMMHGANRDAGDYRAVYRAVEDLLRGDDLTFANLEFPIDPARPYADFPAFNGTPAYLQAAVDAGVDAFSLANNHAFDGAEEGILQTLRALDRAGRVAGRTLYRAGTRANPGSPFAAARFEVGGARISFLSATQFLNTRAGRERVDLVDYRDRAAADAFVARVRAESLACDVLVVSYHAGVEYSAGPRSGLDAFLDRLAAAGATVVHGHHPHVMQAARFAYAGPFRRLVLPSMGNFISGQAEFLDPFTGGGAVAPGTGDSAIVRVRVLCGGGWATVLAVEPIPVAVHRDARGSLAVALVERLAAGADGGTGTAWRTYYRGRLADIRGLFAGVVTSSGR
jgi:poly-gamma-glutamate capsule biosynthesis protein CapA/YwtB (metallophosphatase superfamily)